MTEKVIRLTGGIRKDRVAAKFQESSSGAADAFCDGYVDIVVSDKALKYRWVKVHVTVTIGMNIIVFDCNEILDEELAIGGTGFGFDNAVWYVYITFETGPCNNDVSIF